MISVEGAAKQVSALRSVGRCALGLAVLALGCGPQQRPAHSDADHLPPMGLYSVVERECQNPFDEPDDCPLMAYMELTHMVLPGGAERSAVVIFWFAPQETLTMYTEAVWQLRGRFEGEEKYVLHDEGAVRDWLVVAGPDIREYDLESFTTDERREIRLRSRLSLIKVERTPELNAALRILPE